MSVHRTIANRAAHELDVRNVPKPQRHPVIFDRFAKLSPTGSFLLINNHDPIHLRREFDRDHRGGYDWRYLESGPVWRIRITRLASADPPRVVHDARASTSPELGPDAAQVSWALDVRHRQMDSNIISLRPGTRIEAHAGPDLDALMYILAGGGELATEIGVVPLESGSLIWLPRRSRHAISAAAAGLSYLTVHPRRQALSIGTPSERGQLDIRAHGTAAVRIDDRPVHTAAGEKDAMVDEWGRQSFPASDPPSNW